MRIVLAAGAAGSLFGALAAIAVTKLGSPPPAPVTPERHPAVASAVRIPSGWNPSFLSRLADLESRLGTLESAPPATSGASESPPPGDVDWEVEHAAQIDEQYRKDLEMQEQKLTEHAREPLDSTWARSQSEIITRALESAVDARYPMKVGRVDCRSATCVAELVYASPDDALADRDLLTRKIVDSCRGLSSALNPPTGPGEYTTTVIYDCR